MAFFITKIQFHFTTTNAFQSEDLSDACAVVPTLLGEVSVDGQGLTSTPARLSSGRGFFTVSVEVASVEE